MVTTIGGNFRDFIFLNLKIQSWNGLCRQVVGHPNQFTKNDSQQNEQNATIDSATMVKLGQVTTCLVNVLWCNLWSNPRQN